MRYFDPFYARNHTVIPGLGTIHTHGVADAYTSSLDHHFLAEGADKPHFGHVRFTVAIEDDGSIVWEFVHAYGKTNNHIKPSGNALIESEVTDFPAAAIAAMRKISETLEDRAPTEFFFDVYQAASDEVRKLDHKRKGLVRSVQHMNELLSDRTAPEQHFVSKDENEGKPGYYRPATPAEKAERRAWWDRQLKRYKRELVEHDNALADRTAMLKQIIKDLRNWSENPSTKVLPSKVIADAVLASKNPKARIAA